MLVVDAGAFAEVVVGGPRSSAARSALGDDGEWVVPEHFTIEVLSVLRRLHLAGALTAAGLGVAGDRLARTAVIVAPTPPLIARILALVPNVSADDAAYVALAERLDVPLVTADLRLVRADGPTCRFIPVT